MMFKRSTRLFLIPVLGLSLLALSSSCKKAEEGTGDEEKTAKAWKPTGNEGTITGSIAYNGAVAAPKKIDTSADPVCASKNPNLEADDIKVTNGKLANAFVYIKEGKLTDGSKVADYSFEVPGAPVVLNQLGCHYDPHVMGIQTNQVLKVTNSDPTQHNVHPGPQLNTEWNQSQAQGAAPIEKKFDHAEVLIPVKCNQHPWMKSYIGVLKHPFFAVSAADGSFTIKGVPPGTYTVVAWHEGPGKGTELTPKTVTVPAKGSVTADFAFGTASAASASTLEVMPALDLPMLGGH